VFFPHLTIPFIDTLLDITQQTMNTVEMDQTFADQMVKEAVAYCANLKFDGDQERTLNALDLGTCDVCSLLSESLVVQIGDHLGGLDKNIKAVYRYIPEHTTRRGSHKVSFPTNSDVGINLVAWVERKNASLDALGRTLEAVIRNSRRKISCRYATPACFSLDLQTVDDLDLVERRGYGAVVDSSYIRSTKIWSREETRSPEPERLHLRERDSSQLTAPINLELTPESVLIAQALEIERLEPEHRSALQRRLIHLKRTLIQRIISDQPAYINIAKNWFESSDLADILERRIGQGKIGGKSAGLLLAARILESVADEELKSALCTPESYFLGSDLIYIFMAMNGLMHWNDQKYKPEEQIYADYDRIVQEFKLGKFPPEVLDELRQMLDKIGSRPLIVRSSSQLEDNFGTSFAGKYNSYFCPNQGSPQENLKALTSAIIQTYASTLKPEALLYRRSKDLQDYDERMAVLIQVVQGEAYGKYFLPHGAGVAFSRNIYRWAPQIRREDGILRLVWGLGTRAVEREGNEYPRLVALSHPTLQPDDSCRSIRQYSQHYVDLIDLEENQVKTLPIHEVLNPDYNALRFIAQLEKDGYFTTPRSQVKAADIPKLAITFEAFMSRTRFPDLVARLLRNLEEHYHDAVDVEFAVHITDTYAQPAELQISLLQCRPQSYLLDKQAVQLPENLLPEDNIFSTAFIIPSGYLEDIQYVIFVSPEAYFALPTPEARTQVGRMVGKLNEALAGIPFICVGPGRWGTTNNDLGVFVSYADIYNASALVELSGQGVGPAPEPSLGTHFFLDLMEANIYPLAICLDQLGNVFNRAFFYETPNVIGDWIEVNDQMADCLRVIDARAFRQGYHLELVMDDEAGKAVAFLTM
jgi:hypothetical protein